MEQKLEYINQGRGGYVIYKDGQDDIKLFFEYGAGNWMSQLRNQLPHGKNILLGQKNLPTDGKNLLTDVVYKVSDGKNLLADAVYKVSIRIKK